ncbi:cysteine-rich CWC family protein [Nitrospira sp. M1]
MKRRIPKTCERCQQAFICGLFGCWCGSMPVTNEQYTSIVEQFHECLCPACLAELTGTTLPPAVLKLSVPHTDP